MWEKIRAHPFVGGVISFCVLVGAAIGFLAALGNIWQAFSHDTVPDFLAKRGWAMTMPTWQASLVLIGTFAVFVCQLALLREAYKDRSARYATSQERVQHPHYVFTEAMKVGRRFAPRTCAEMCGEIARAPTSHGRDMLAKQFVGFWIHVTGNVRDIPSDDGSGVAQVPLFEPVSGAQVSLFLELKWRPLILTLKPGTDCVEAKGQIDQIGGNWVVLGPVELIAYGPPDRMVPV